MDKIKASIVLGGKGGEHKEISLNADISNRVDVLEEKLEDVSKDVEGVSKMLDLINGEVV